jgi:hypothetical protein
MLAKHRKAATPTKTRFVAVTMGVLLGIGLTGENSHGQSVDFGPALQAIENLKSATEQLDAALGAIGDTFDAASGSTGDKDKLSRSLFGQALGSHIQVLNQAYIPNPLSSVSYPVSLDEIADPTTRCNGYGKAQKAVDAFKQWLHGSDETLKNGKELVQALGRSQRARRSLVTRMEQCIEGSYLYPVQQFCSDIWLKVEYDQTLAIDLANGKKSVEDLVRRIERDQNSYTDGVRQTLEKYEKTVEWINGTYPGVDRVCSMAETVYSPDQLDTNNESALERFIRSTDTAVTDRQVSNYLASLDPALADIRAQLQAEWDRIERDKQQRLEQVGQSFAGVQRELLDGFMAAQPQQLRNNAECSAIAAQIQANKKWLAQVVPNQSRYAGSREAVSQVRRATDENLRQYRLRGC